MCGSFDPDGLTGPHQRVFGPLIIYGPIDTASIIQNDGSYTYVPCHKSKLEYQFPRLPMHPDSIIVAVDGGCKNNGLSNPHGSFGIFFGPGAAQNNNGSLSTSIQVHTSQIAELVAAELALDQVLGLVKYGIFNNEMHGTLEGGSNILRMVVIKTDSEHLYRGMTERVFKWEQNGWRTASDSVVVHRPFFEKLQRQVAEFDGLGVKVLFWQVPRAENREADALANEAAARWQAQFTNYRY